jgi:ubiquitin-protein ligase E3 C
LVLFANIKLAELGINLSLFGFIGSGEVKKRLITLTKGGSEIAVNNDNTIDYIHKVADYKLNRQIRSQCNAFRFGT